MENSLSDEDDVVTEAAAEHVRKAMLKAEKKKKNLEYLNNL